jgi:hypothetical protein
MILLPCYRDLARQAARHSGDRHRTALVRYRGAPRSPGLPIRGGGRVTVQQPGTGILACAWCVQADPGLICRADLGGQCPAATGDAGVSPARRAREADSGGPVNRAGDGPG